MNSSDPNTSGKSFASQKSSGICSVCYLTRKLHHKGGNVHLPGHRADRCLGSNLPPLAESHPSLVTETSTGNINASIDQTGGATNSTHVRQSTPTADYSKHPFLQFQLLRHIPKGARTCTGLLLTDIINRLILDPMQLDNWR